MDPDRDIAAAEECFREKLESYLTDIFREVSLDSHGPAHHRRVWHFAKDLLSWPGILDTVTDSSLPAKLLIASYLHDSGMVTERGPRHGYQSRLLCERFLLNNGLRPEDCTDLLEAVENHDNKEYTSPAANSLLHDLLTIADDLDALGYTGIYRYLEIYLLRGIPVKETAALILSNVRGRFANFERKFGHSPALVNRYRPRLEIITGFFEKFSIQSVSYRFGTASPSGYCGVAELIEDMVRNNITLDEVIDSATELPDRVISWYFGELKRELG
jgi:hypothetical protein